MKIEECIFRVERRSAGGCLDLACAFTRKFLTPLATLTLIFAIPNCILCYWLASTMRDTLLLNVVVFGVFSMFFSGTLVAAVGPQVFGVPISISNALLQVAKQFFKFGFWTTIYRLMLGVSGFCFMVPAFFLGPLYGHVAEICFLEQGGFSKIMTRHHQLASGAGFSRNLVNSLLLLGVWLVMLIAIFYSIDFVMGYFLNTPVFSGRLANSPDYANELGNLISEDPKVMTCGVATLWLTFPLIRLAWFFAYLDQRIRNECWDIALQFQVEASRLEESP